MICVGVDLAWGRRARTGVCAVDARGRVLTSATVTTDQEILDWFADHAPRPAVVGFDAPIVLTNANGRRVCEQLLSRAFGAQKAGAHSSNLSMPVFADGGRALFLARTLGLVTDPGPPGRPADSLAIEVYPHSALVAWFGLPERLAYKARSRRGVAERRTAMAELVSRLESLDEHEPGLDVRANPRWGALAAAVHQADRPFQLEAVEDELDAHLCAYVARCFGLDRADGGARVRILGEWSEGAVVTPVDARQAAVLDALMATAPGDDATDLIGLTGASGVTAPRPARR